MPVRLTTHARERSSYVVRASFTDEEGSPVAPETLSWTLTDASGAVVNGRDSVSVAGPSSTENIVLSGDDLALAQGRDKEARILTLTGTFHSDLAGQSLPFAESARFLVENLVALS
ncbi:MAG: hypothetical protein KKA60_01020 [Proteobacteria bacterium]|nr:hypothetical protein [Pseudomonadota bacterium]